MNNNFKDLLKYCTLGVILLFLLSKAIGFIGFVIVVSIIANFLEIKVPLWGVILLWFVFKYYIKKKKNEAIERERYNRTMEMYMREMNRRITIMDMLNDRNNMFGGFGGRR